MKLKLLFSTLFVSLLCGFLSPIQASATSYGNVDIIDDQIMNNTGGMSTAQINTFLNGFTGTCIGANSGFTTPDPKGYAGGAYQYGGNVDAGTAIRDIAVHYNLNPQVLMATLEKEQGLIDRNGSCAYSNPAPAPAGADCNSPYGTGPSYCSYACQNSPAGGCVTVATGYACPGYCRNDFNGFSKQISGTSWVLRFAEARAYGQLSGYPGYDSGDENISYSGPMTAGYRQRVAGGASVYYDGSYTDKDGNTMYIANGSTASMLSYTPFYARSYTNDKLFHTSFVNWFGSTIYHGVPYAHPSGTLIRDQNQPQVYLIQNGQRLPVTTATTLYSYGYNFGQVKFANYYDDALPVGTALSPMKEGTIFKGSGPAIYVFRMSGTTPSKSIFPTWEIFTGLGYSLRDVLVIPDAEIPAIDFPTPVSATQHPPGTIIQQSGTPQIYQIQVDGTRRLFPNQETFFSYGYTFNQTKPATTADMALPIGVPMSFKEGTLVQGSGPQISAVIGQDISQTKAFISSWFCFQQFGCSYPMDVLRIADWEYAALPTYGPAC